MGYKKLIVILALSFASVGSTVFLKAQTMIDKSPYYDNSKKFSVSVYGMYISSGELQNNINNPDPFLRDASIELKGGYGYGGEIIYNPNLYDLGIGFYLSSEYIKITDDELALRFIEDSASASVRFIEEIYMIPFEAGLKWSLPVGSDRFKIYIGGGAGVYFGDRKRSIGQLRTSTISKKPGFSLNVLSGIEYYFGRNLSLDFEFKFRDASFEAESMFGADYININGHDFRLENPFRSRLLINGTRLSLGLKYNF
ncbi:MAG: outer membrane beta-barrel protein [Chlorobi bacterium]|nr:outer membrane beta-barrel protein [Chlorobiota bacterium]MCI0717060.1 outer membrane beta-barrel protein [Chlorobiota bacterium]